MIAFGAQWICQGITVELSNKNKVFFVLPKPTAIPPQLAYYVQDGRLSDTVHKKEHFDKSAATSNGGVLSVIEAPYSKRPSSPKLQNSNFGFVKSQKYPKINSNLYQPPVQVPFANQPSYNFQQYYGPNQPNPDSIVRATPPPERRYGRTAPPPSKKVTFQVNMLERNYRAQQDFEQRNRSPHFRTQGFQNLAIRQVQPPILTTEAPRNHQVLRTNINRLKKTQKEHFNVDEDEQPAHQNHQNINDSDDDVDVEQITPRYVYNYKGLNKFRDEESHYDRLKKGYQHDEPSSRYEESEPKFTSFYDDIDEGAKLLNHADFVTPASYQNYNNDHEEHFGIPNFSSKYTNYDDDESDQPSSKYRSHDDDDDERNTFDPHKSNVDSYGKRYITNEEVKQFDKYLRTTPRYVGPKKNHRSENDNQNGYNDRSDKGDDHEFVPYKMLASVRHSEQYEHQPKDLSNPSLKERILEKGGHVVYTEQGYEDKQYDHGNEEKVGKIKHRKRRHVSEDKFPFYYTSTRNIPKYSAIRYAENGEHLRNGKTFHLYNTKRKMCDDVEFDDENVNDKEVDLKSKIRLSGLEDKIDCLKEKLFGVNPLNNPIFQEQFVDETVPVVKTRRARNSFGDERYSTLVNVFDDVISNIEQSPTEPDHVPSESKLDYIVFPPYVDLANSRMTSKNASILDVIASEKFNQTKPPVVILMNKKSFAQMTKNNSKTKLTEYLKYPQNDGTEVFIFDVSKFIPKLSFPANDEYYDSVESIVTTVAPEVEYSKLSKKKFKKRKSHKKNLDLKQNKYSSERHTNVLREGILLAKTPYLLPGSYDLHNSRKLY